MKMLSEKGILKTGAILDPISGKSGVFFQNAGFKEAW
jgi:hypothetical protein